ncbi:MAG: tetratricopeptide repeat protein [Magnetococcales bacterium]|nr:tetratricopeptide repeat protein [Magnetococcales bacterium]
MNRAERRRQKKISKYTKNANTSQNIKSDGKQIAFNKAVKYHQSGLLADAIYWYKKVLDIHSDNVDALLSMGDALTRIGKVNEAIIACKKAISINPKFAQAYNNLGIALKNKKCYDEAVQNFQKAIAINPNLVEVHDNLGITLYQQEKFDEAIASHKKAISINPSFEPAHNNLAIALFEQNRLEEAFKSNQKAVSLNPNNPINHYHLGLTLKKQGKLDEAFISLTKSIQINPNFVEAISTLGSIKQEQGKLSSAIENYQKAISLKPSYVTAYNNLGVALKEQGKLEEAVKFCQKAISKDPDFATTYINLGSILEEQGKFDEAIAVYQKAISLNPDYVTAYTNLGVALKEQGKLDEALEVCQKAILIEPENSQAYNIMGSVLQKQYKLNDAVANYQKAIFFKPDCAEFSSNLLFCSQYIPGQSLENLYLIHKHEVETFNNSLKAKKFNHDNIISLNRKLRIGVVSRDLGKHPVGFFMLGFFKYHSKSDLEIFCYSDRNPDNMTKQFESYSDNFVFTKFMRNSELAQLINDDKIDILLDLAGHTAKNRLPVFLQKPSPIQISWAGYVGTTGLPTMDYVIADKCYAPDGDEKYYTEKIIRMPDSWVSYTPPNNAPTFDSPHLDIIKDHIMLGNFGNPEKINEKMLEVWSQILLLSPNAKLLLIYSGMDSQANIIRINNYFERAGVDIDRIIIEGRTPHLQLLNSYNRVDLALDTLPYSGGLTTIEALFMGVPVVTTRGETFAGRHAYSVLNSVGLNKLVTDNLEEYVKLVVDLISSPKKLQNIRNGLSSKLKNSPICDHNKFTSFLTAEFKRIWQEWCEKN